MNTQYDSRTADKFVVRLPDGLRDDVQGAADYLDTSMNTVFVQAVRQYLDSQQRQKLLLDAPAKAVTGKEELEAVLHWRDKHTQAVRERDALQVLLTAADERADVLDTENKRLDLMVSQADYNYDADRMQFKARIDVLEGLLLQTNELLYAIQGDPGAVPSSSIDSMRGRVFEELRRNRSTSVLHPQNL